MVIVLRKSSTNKIKTVYTSKTMEEFLEGFYEKMDKALIGSFLHEKREVDGELKSVYIVLYNNKPISKDILKTIYETFKRTERRTSNNKKNSKTLTVKRIYNGSR